MHPALDILALVAVVGFVTAGARALGWNEPLALVVVGIGASFVPHFLNIALTPDLVLIGLLPPLLYAAAIRTSLVDFKANVEGSQVAFEAVAPLMEKTDPKLVEEIEADFEAVYASLEPYETKEWPGFVLYEELDKADTRKLAQGINTLAEKLSLVPAQIAKGEQA